MENVMNGTLQAGRDIGDITIIEGNGNEQYINKPFTMCTSFELKEDRTYRRELINKERKLASNNAFSLLKILIITIPGLLIWYQINGGIHFYMLPYFFFTIILPFGNALNLFANDNEFTILQRQAIHEINILLKQRGDE